MLFGLGMILLTPTLVLAGAGSVDCTFGTMGQVSIDRAGTDDEGWAGAVYQSGPQAGKIVLAGSTKVGTNEDWSVVRLNANGTVDTTFATNGWYTKDFAGNYDRPWAVAIQSDGKIVIVGTANRNSPYRDDLGMVRLNADGSLDTGFGASGVVFSQIGDSNSYWNGVAVHTDGTIYVAGSYYSASNQISTILKYNSSGGYVTSYTKDFNAYESFTSVAVDANGNVVAAGYSSNGTGTSAGVISRFATGSPAAAAFDTSVSFGGTSGSLRGVAVHSDGRIAASGSESFSGTSNVTVASLTSAGALDATFSGDGKQTINMGGSNEGKTLVFQSDGKLLVAARTTGFGVARLTTAGELDTTFSGDGIANNLNPSIDQEYGVLLNAGQEIFLYGTDTSGANRNIAVFKLLSSSLTNMLYCSATVEQISGSIAPGTNDVEIIKYAVTMIGSTSPESLTGLQFNTTGTTAASDVTSARVYYTGTSNAFSTATPYGSVVNSPNGTYNVSASQPLVDGTNYFWLAYNVSGSAVSGNYLDAQGPSLTLSASGAKTPLVTNPAGNRRIVSGVASQTSSPNLPFGDVGGNPLTITNTMTIAASGAITDLDLGLNISHTWTGDVIVELTSPAGTKVKLVDRPGDPAVTDGCGLPFAPFTLDDSAATAIEEVCPPVGGSTYRPNNLLSAFNGQEIHGVWTITVTDGYPGYDDGVLNSWTMIYSVPPPNEAPTDITLSASAINENVAANSTVGSLDSTDPNNGNTFTYSLVAGTGDTDNGSFTISGSSLRITSSPNYEAKGSYSVRVRTTDQGGLIFDKAFTITINDLNEAPTDLALSASSINENVVANSTVGSLSSTDPDLGNTFTYVLVTGTGSTDNGAFNISGSSLRITDSPDFETKSTYSVRVRTTDQGSLTFEKAFTITINNLNEAPTVTVPASLAVTEDITGAVTGISFADVDAGGGSVSVTLSVGSGTLAASSGGGVTIGGGGTASLTLVGTIANLNVFIAGGNVTFTTAANATAAVTLTVSINDNGNSGTGGPKSAVDVTTINVTAVNDAPAFTTTPAISGSPVLSQLLGLTGTTTGDPDGDSVTLSYQWQADGGAISGATGSSYQLTLAELGKSVTCRVTADDGQGSPNSQVLVTTAGVVVRGDRIGVYRDGEWYFDMDDDGAWEEVGDGYGYFGASDMVPVPADWNGDGYAESAVYRAGQWYFDTSGNDQWEGEATDLWVADYGDATDIPVVGDWNGDGLPEIGIYRPENSTWYLDTDRSFTYDPAVDVAATFGFTGALPVVGDWNGNGQVKIGVYFEGQWYLDLNGNGAWDGAGTDLYAPAFGAAGMAPVVGDWNGSGSARIGCYRDGYWYLDQDGDGIWDPAKDKYLGTYGVSGMIPLVGRW
jgi:uncharacterized delta-60 repeat protein